MNKPVAWISRLPEGDVYNCAWAEKQNDDDIPLYTHQYERPHNTVLVPCDKLAEMQAEIKALRMMLANRNDIIDRLDLK